MKIWLSVIAITLVIGIMNYVQAAPEMSCKDFVASLTKKQLGGISACSKSMKFKNPKDKAAKMNCILKCVLNKEKMLDADGQFLSAEEFEVFVKEFIPDNLVDKAAPKFRVCRDNSGVLDNKEEFCKTYDPLIQCMLDVIGSLCK